MAKNNSQRIVIWIIAVVMLAGSIGGFVAMMVAPGNEAKDQAALDVATKEWDRLQSEWQKKTNAQAAELSERYFADFSSFSSRVAKFSAKDIDDLEVEDLRVGDGPEVKKDSKLAAYYLGWNPDGKIFDSSIEKDSLKAPIIVDGVATANVIEGWQEGLLGMKVGGVRELTIPSDMAYGETGGGDDDIPPNTPLKFIVMAIETPKNIPAPEMPELLRKEYKRQYGIDY